MVVPLLVGKWETISNKRCKSCMIRKTFLQVGRQISSKSKKLYFLQNSILQASKIVYNEGVKK